MVRAGGDSPDTAGGRPPTSTARAVILAPRWPPLNEIPLARQEIDAQLIRDAAEKAQAMFGDAHHALWDGRAWRLGSHADVAWINDAASAGNTITSAIPPVFASYCTLELPEANDRTELAPARAGCDRANHRADTGAAMVAGISRHRSEPPGHEAQWPTQVAH